MAKIVAIDVSGTHITVGIKDNKKISITKQYTKDVKSIKDIIPKGTKKLCIGAAGIITKERVKLTNAPFTIKRNELPQKTLILNDFALYAYALNTKIKTKVLRGKPSKDNAIVIGAGTGLGFCFADYRNGAYHSRATEAGQSYASIDEPKFLTFLQKQCKAQPRYEDIISGRGIMYITKLYAPKLYKEANKKSTINEAVKVVMAKPPKKVYDTFAKYYARFINNVSYFLPRGGIYITGGIAQKNSELFQSKAFKDELKTLKKEKPQLANIPLILITEYEASIKGGLWAAEHLL